MYRMGFYGKIMDMVWIYSREFLVLDIFQDAYIINTNAVFMGEAKVVMYIISSG